MATSSSTARRRRTSTSKTLEEQVLKDLGLPKDYVPEDENEAYRLMTSWLED